MNQPKAKYVKLMDKQYEGTIIGTGCARSGTTSTARLLQAWGLRVCHEGKPPDRPHHRLIPSQCWRPDDPRREAQYRRALGGFEKVDGDIACWHVPVIRRLMEDLPQPVKLIYVYRPRELVIDSCTAHLAERRIRSNQYWAGASFPTYPEEMPAWSAWGRYWDEVDRIMRTTIQLLDGYMLDIRHLQLESTQYALASYLGLDEWEHIPNCHHNRRRESHVD